MTSPAAANDDCTARFTRPMVPVWYVADDVSVQGTPQETPPNVAVALAVLVCVPLVEAIGPTTQVMMWLLLPPTATGSTAGSVTIVPDPFLHVHALITAALNVLSVRKPAATLICTSPEFSTVNW
jgi:hypothetical protein